MAGSVVPNTQSYQFVTKVVKKETAYGTAFSDTDVVTNWLVANDVQFTGLTPTYRDDSKELNGYSGATTHAVESWQGERDWKSFFSPQVYQAFLAWQLGNVSTVGAADPYSHTNKWSSICLLSPPSFSFLEAPGCAGFTADIMEYKGACVEETDVTINGLSSIEFAAKFVTDGSETPKPALILPTTVYLVDKLIGANVTLKLGPLGTEDLTPDFRGAKVNIKSGLTRKTGVVAGLYSPGFNFGASNPMPTISITIVGDKSHVVWGYMKSKTVLKLDLLIDPGATPARSTEWKCNQCICKAKEAPQGAESQLQIDILPEWNSTDGGPITIINKTQEPGYLT